ncbi:MAG: hypothetical protein DRP94_08025 [Candidatus Latescibacterota bacterium]|nr:MAG: hypothetical protein DRP94_08025 [Candidatus Latescibacterota bacterium]
MDPGERVALASVGVNAGLSLTKLGLSFMSGSLALAADALHSFTEVVSSLGLVVKGRGAPKVGDVGLGVACARWGIGALEI